MQRIFELRFCATWFGHHTHCGMQTFCNEDLTAKIKILRGHDGSRLPPGT